jgi:hypothetical protein
MQCFRNSNCFHPQVIGGGGGGGLTLLGPKERINLKHGKTHPSFFFAVIEVSSF